jgi:hypothetical protein
MSTGKRTAFAQCIEHLENTLNSAHRKPSAVFFNCSSGTTIAEAVKVQHASIFSIYEHVDISHNTHNSQLTLHADSQASDRGAEAREGRTMLGVQAKPPYSQMALSRKPFRTGHMFISTFLFRMTYTMTSQNIDNSSRDTL